jgi:hypothetical protein
LLKLYGLNFMLDSKAIQVIADTARLAVVIEWRSQGHELTGKAAQSIEDQVTQTANGTNIDFYIQDYMANINQGVPSNKIPYSPGSGARYSKYIAGLTRYARLRFSASVKEAESIAFAIANKHLKEGLPSIGSKRFSKTGRRTGFIEQGLQSEEDKISKLIEDAVDQSYTALIEGFFKSIISGR